MSYSQTVEAAFVKCLDRANTDGRAEECLRAIRDALHRLEFAPHKFGEPLYRLDKLKLNVRTAVILPVSIDFGVSEEQPIVFIKDVKYLPAK